MNPDKSDIFEAAGHNDGLRVPEGYFENFVARMEAKLPETEFEQSADNTAAAPVRALKPNVWQRVRPYVYMAAMFAGAWCMLKMFSLMSSSADSISFDNPVVATAICDDQFVEDYYIDDYSQYDLYDDMMADSSLVIDAGFLSDSILSE